MIPPQLAAFLIDMLPVVGLLVVLAVAMRTWRWHRQRALHAYTPAQLHAAFRFMPALRARYVERGSMSYYELQRAIRANQQVIAAELRRRRY